VLVRVNGVRGGKIRCLNGLGATAQIVVANRLGLASLLCSHRQIYLMSMARNTPIHAATSN